MTDIEIIAEIGVNHDGSMDKAHTLIDNAKYAGCDTVKFQLFHGDRYPDLQLDAGQLSDLRQYALAIGLGFLCTPDDIVDARAIKDIGCDRIKIGSSNITNIELLKYVATLNMDVVLSTGACDFREFITAMHLLPGVRKWTVMHCVSAYPSPIAELNLGFITELRERGADVGYSDHTIGSNYQTALVALGLGATVFEKHLTHGHGGGPR